MASELFYINSPGQSIQDFAEVIFVTVAKC